jgi:hypothetical protein
MSTIHTAPKNRRLRNVVRYMLKPNILGLAMTTDDMKELLVLQMKGFRYHRMWGRWTDRPKKSDRAKTK